MSAHDLAKARADADFAKEQLLDAAHTLQARLSPATLADHALEVVRARGEEAARDAVDVAQSRPLATAAVGAGIVALMARRPLARLIGRLAAGKKPRARPGRGSRRNGEHT